MKRVFYTLFIAITVFVSFGFREGCDVWAYCSFFEKLIRITWASNTGLGERFLGEINTDDCIAILHYEPTTDLTQLRANNKILVAVGNFGAVIYSSDGGKTWEDRSIIVLNSTESHSRLEKNLYGVDFIDDFSGDSKLAVCGEDGTIYHTTSSGGVWDWQPVNTITTHTLRDIITIGCCLYIAVGDNGTIIKTNDNGQTWEDKSQFPDFHFKRIFNGAEINEFGYAWAVANNGQVYSTIDYGNSWVGHNVGVPEDLNDVQFRNRSQGMVVGNNGLVRYTTNGGITWQEDDYFNGLTDGDIIALETVDFNTGIALVRNKTLDGGETTTMFIVSSEPLSADDYGHLLPLKHSLEQNYPNPFNPTTNIGYRIPEFGFVTLKVYDLLGKEVATLVNEEKPAGNYEVNFDASGLSSGIYFYKLKVGNEFIETKKLVLLK
jgi:photosystem II stability/assembly factor-like uncharacterized protein